MFRRIPPYSPTLRFVATAPLNNKFLFINSCGFGASTLHPIPSSTSRPYFSNNDKNSAQPNNLPLSDSSSSSISHAPRFPYLEPSSRAEVSEQISRCLLDTTDSSQYRAMIKGASFSGRSSTLSNVADLFRRVDPHSQLHLINPLLPGTSWHQALQQLSSEIAQHQAAKTGEAPIAESKPQPKRLILCFHGSGIGEQVVLIERACELNSSVVVATIWRGHYSREFTLRFSNVFHLGFGFTPVDQREHHTLTTIFFQQNAYYFEITKCKSGLFWYEITKHSHKMLEKLTAFLKSQKPSHPGSPVEAAVDIDVFLQEQFKKKLQLNESSAAALCDLFALKTVQSATNSIQALDDIAQETIAALTRAEIYVSDNERFSQPATLADLYNVRVIPAVVFLSDIELFKPYFESLKNFSISYTTLMSMTVDDGIKSFTVEQPDCVVDENGCVKFNLPVPAVEGKVKELCDDVLSDFGFIAGSQGASSNLSDEALYSLLLNDRAKSLKQNKLASLFFETALVQSLLVRKKLTLHLRKILARCGVDSPFGPNIPKQLMEGAELIWARRLSSSSDDLQINYNHSSTSGDGDKPPQNVKFSGYYPCQNVYYKYQRFNFELNTRDVFSPLRPEHNPVADAIIREDCANGELVEFWYDVKFEHERRGFAPRDLDKFVKQVAGALQNPLVKKCVHSVFHVIITPASMDDDTKKKLIAQLQTEVEPLKDVPSYYFYTCSPGSKAFDNIFPQPIANSLPLLIPQMRSSWHQRPGTLPEWKRLRATLRNFDNYCSFLGSKPDLQEWMLLQVQNEFVSGVQLAPRWIEIEAPPLPSDAETDGIHEAVNCKLPLQFFLEHLNVIPSRSEDEWKTNLNASGLDKFETDADGKLCIYGSWRNGPSYKCTIDTKSRPFVDYLLSAKVSLGMILTYPRSDSLSLDSCGETKNFLAEFVDVVDQLLATSIFSSVLKWLEDEGLLAEQNFVAWKEHHQQNKPEQNLVELGASFWESKVSLWEKARSFGENSGDANNNSKNNNNAKRSPKHFISMRSITAFVYCLVLQTVASGAHTPADANEKKVIDNIKNIVAVVENTINHLSKIRTVRK